MKVCKEVYPILDAIALTHMEIPEISKKTGIPRTTFYHRLNHPDTFRLWELQEINRVAPFDVEKFVGGNR